MQSIVFPIIRFLHDLFTAVWVGGLVLMSLVILPALKKNPQVKEPKVAIGAIQNRLKIFAIISMVGLVLTGLLLSNKTSEFSGLFNFSNAFSLMLSIKHILMILMSIFAMVRLALNKQKEKQLTSKLEKASAMVLFINTLVALVVLFLSAYISTVL